MSAIRKSVCVMVPDERGRFLVVSRGPDSPHFGMPGGKVEPRESLEAAARRELWEETGLIANGLVPVYRSSPEGVYECTCFLAESWTGTPRDSEEGRVFWAEPSELAQTPPFAEYNLAAMMALRDMIR